MGSSSSKCRSYSDNRCTELARYDDGAAESGRRHHKSEFVHPSSLVKHLQPGDLVQKKGAWWSPHIFYSHFAVYFGNGDIVHVVGNGIVREDLEEAFGSELVRKANIHDDLVPPRSSREVVLTARSHIGTGWRYNLLSNNCEHFATLCRYGKKMSLQAFGIGDVCKGRVSPKEYMGHMWRSVKERCETFISWGRRHLFGAVGMITGAANRLAISY